MIRSVRGVVLAGLAGLSLVAGCALSTSGPEERFLEETRAFCAEVGDYRDAAEGWQAGGDRPDWHTEATALKEALDEWEQARPDELPADIDTAIDDYYWSFVERLRGWENIQALDDECGSIADSLEQYVSTLR